MRVGGSRSLRGIINYALGFGAQLRFLADGQLVASFCAPSCKNLASVLGLHSFKETVSPGSFPFFELAEHYSLIRK